MLSSQKMCCLQHMQSLAIFTDPKVLVVVVGETEVALIVLPSIKYGLSSNIGGCQIHIAIKTSAANKFSEIKVS